MMGIKFQYNVSSCSSPYGSGTDGPGYFYFSPVSQKTGELEKGKQYKLEVFFSHHCRDFDGAYDLDVHLVSPSGNLLQFSLTGERYSSYRSKRFSTVNNYCLMYSCGTTYFNYAITVPKNAEPGVYSVRASAKSDPSKSSYSYPEIANTFNFSSVFFVNDIQPSTPAVTPSAPAVTPTAPAITPTASATPTLPSDGASQPTPKPSAEPETKVTFQETLTKFNGKSRALTSAHKSRIKGIMIRAKGNPKFICIGTFVKLSDVDLALSRARAVCSFAKSLDGSHSYFAQVKSTKEASFDSRVIVVSK
jgi:hypothetical protein